MLGVKSLRSSLKSTTSVFNDFLTESKGNKDGRFGCNCLSVLLEISETFPEPFRLGKAKDCWLRLEDVDC